MGEFQGEQAQVSAVEQKAAKLDDKGKKTHEQLDSELKAKHDVFFKQVDDTQKTFKEAAKLKDPAAITEMGKDKQEIKDLLSKAASSGETILNNKEANPDFLSIRQSADRISTITKTVGENLALFQNIDKANQSLVVAKESASAADKIWGEGEHPDKDWQKTLTGHLQTALGNLGEDGAMGYLKNYTSLPSQELQKFYDNVKKPIDDLTKHVTDLRVQYLEKFEYNTDEKKEQMTVDLKQLLGVKKGDGDAKGAYGEGFDTMVSLMGTGKAQVDKAAGENDDTQKKVFLDSAKEQFSRAEATAEKIGPALAEIDINKLPIEFQVVHFNMKLNTAATLSDATAQLSKLEKGTTLVDSKGLVDSSEKEYSEGDQSPKKNYEAALAARDKAMAGKELDLTAPELKDSTEKGLTGLCALKGKLSTVDRATLPREYQARFDALASTVDSNIKELAQVQIMLKNKALIDDMDKNGQKYFTIEKQEVNGMNVVVVKQTPEFDKLSPGQQALVQAQFLAVHAEVALDLTKKMDLKEDKDWNEGMKKFEQGIESGNLGGSKKQLLDYYNKFKDNPEKAVQINSARSLLQVIVRKEFDEAKANLETLTGIQQHHDEGGLDNINHQELGGSVGMAWTKMDSAEREVASGKYLTIEEVWNKVGKPGGKDAVSKGISFLDPSVIQGKLSEPDPVKRRANILEIARAAKDAGLTAFAKKYFEMYFAGEIVEKKKTITRDQVEKAFKANPESDKEVKDGIKGAHDQALTKFIAEYNRQHPYRGIDPEVGTQWNKIQAKWEANYQEHSGDIEQRVRSGIVDELWTKEAKKSIHSVYSEAAAVDNKDDPVNVWNEAYSGHFGVAENITGATLVFTADDIRNTCAQIAVSILYLEMAAAAAAITAAGAGALVLGGGIVAGEGASAASLLALAESGLAVSQTTVYAAGATSFLVEGAVMHSVSVGLNEGSAGFKDPKAFFKGLATTYATLGIMKGVGSVLGKVGGKAAQGVAEGSGEFITPFSKELGQTGLNVVKGAANLTGKSVLDSALMTGLSFGTEKLFNGKTMTADQLTSEFGKNFVTFMVMGGVHKAVETGEAPTEVKKLTKEELATRDAMKNSLDADKLAQRARESAEAAKKEGKTDTAKLEAEAKVKEAQAKAADLRAKEALEKERQAAEKERQAQLEIARKLLAPKEISAADQEIIDRKPDNQPTDPALKTTIEDNAQLEQQHKDLTKQLAQLEDDANFNQMTGKDNPELAKQIEDLKVEVKKYGDTLKFKREIEQETRAEFVQNNLADAAKLHPDIPLPVLQELMTRDPLGYERAIHLSEQAPKLEAMGLGQAAKDLRNLTGDFASVDGSPIKTAEQRAAFLEKMLKLSPLDLEWYTTRPETTLDSNDPQFKEKFNKLKEFSAQFMSDKVMPLLVAQNLPADQLILEIHRWQARGSEAQRDLLLNPAIGYDISGKVRDVVVRVGEYIAPIPGRVPELLGKMSTKMQGIETELANLKQTNPDAYEKAVVKTAFYALQTFVEIHPMTDGNGRTGRALYEYYIVKFLGPGSKYRRLPMEAGSDGESSLHGDLHTMNGKLSKTLYEGNPLGNISGLAGEQLSQKIDATDLGKINSDPLYEEFFANYIRLMASSP